VLEGVGCLSKIIPSGGTIIEETVQIIGETAETTSAVVKNVDGADGVTEIKMEDIKSGEPVLPDQTIGFNIGTELGTCTVLGSLVKGPQADLFRAIIGYEGKLLNKFEKSLQFYLDQPRTVRDKTLKGCGFHYGQKVCIELNVGVFEDGSSDFADGWVRLSGGRVVPDSLERRGLGAAINTEILLNFGDLTLSSTEILFENIEDTGQISLRKILAVPYNKIKDYLRNDEVSAKVLIRDPSAIDVLTGGVGPQSGTVFLGAGESAFPPSPPTINASSRQNNVKLFLSGENAEQFQIYRSTNSGFSVEEQEPIEVIDGNSYTDEGLTAGRTYYYKAVAVSSSGKTSNPSDEASGRLETDYKFAGLGERELSRDAYSLGTLSGRLETVQDGSLVSGADVSLSIPAIELSVDEVQTDENGAFSIEYRAPGEPGNYDLQLNARPEEGARTLRLSLAVQERPEWGRDLAILELVLNDSLTAGGEILETGTETENRGDTDEEGTVSYRLLNRTGTNVASTTKDVSLASGEGRSIPADLPVPDGLAPGSYQLQALIESADDLDRKRANNRATRDMYAPPEPYSTTTYRSAARTIKGEGSTKTIGGTEVTLLNVTDTDVEFEVGGETTGPLPIDGDPQPPWTSSSGDFLILEEGISAVGDTVAFEGGGKAPGASVAPGRIQEKRGRETAFKVKVPEGQTPEPSDMTFPYGPDAGVLESWKSSAGDDFLGPRTAALGLEVSPTAELRTHAGWLEWGGSADSYYKKVAVRPRPIHDLALEEEDIQSVIDNGTEEIPDFIPGAPVKIEGKVENRGDFRETQPIEVRVELEGETVYTEQVTTILARREDPGDPADGARSQSFEFTWPTVGLETGDYEVTVQVPHSADEAPANNKHTETITLQKPPKVDVAVQDASGPYEVGEEIPVRAFVGRQDQPFEGAAVSATLIRPSGEEEEISLDYNADSQLYEATFFANYGGNYRAEVRAQRAPYRPASAEALFAQTYVDVSASLGGPTVEVGRAQTLRIQTSNVAGLYGFSADVVYEEARLSYLQAAGSPLLSGGGDAETTVQAQDRGGRVVTGASRLDPEEGGVTSTQGGRVVSLGFAGRSAGEHTFGLEDVSLVDQEGKAMATRVTSGAPTLAVEEEPAAVSVSVQDTVSTTTQRDTAQITLTNAFRAEGFGGTISFSSSNVRAVDVVEGTVFSENGDAETLFASDIDQEEGTAQFSITRTGDQPGISVGSAPIARLVYEPKASGESPIALEEETVMSGRQDITLPSFTLSDTLAIASAPDDSSGSGEPRVSIAPDTVNVIQKDTTAVAVTVGGVSDLYSFAGDLTFEADEMTFDGIEEGDLLSDEGRVQTSLTYEVKEDTVVVGLSRLNEESGGARSLEADTLFTAQFLRSGTNSTEMTLSNFGILDSDGSQVDAQVDSSLVVAESKKNPAPETVLSFSPERTTPPEGEEFTLAATVEDVTDLFSVATDVSYDPSQLRFVEITEGDFLSEGGSVGTSFTRQVDETSGTITIGLSRLGSDVGGVSTTEPDTLFTLRLERTGTEESQVSFFNTGLLRPDGETEIPSETQAAEIAPLLARSIGVEGGWNMVGMPVEPGGASPKSLGAALPSGCGSLFQWDPGQGSYQEFGSGEALPAGGGAWTFCESSGTATVEGPPASDKTVSVESGWNQVGPFEEAIAPSAVGQDPSGLLQEGAWFRWDPGQGSYAEPSELTPGAGYWVFATESGTLDFSGEGSEASPAATARAQETASGEEKPEGALTLRVTDGTGQSREVYLAPELTEEEQKRWRLPPTGPGEALDVRFGGGFQAAAAESEGESRPSSERAVLMVQGTEGEVTLRMQPSERPSEKSVSSGERSVRVVDAATGRKRVDARLTAESPAATVPAGAERLRAQVEEVPQEAALRKPAPNPVSGRATLEYALPEEREVTLEVYDVLGRRVATLAEGKKEAGVHRAALEAGPLPSGTYFARMRAGSFQKTRRITILK